MVRHARALGLKYIGVSDHSQIVTYANGLTPRRLQEQAEAIAKLNARLKGFRVLHGTECDILPDGSLDFPAEVLRGLDFVIGSVHSSFRMSREEMTARVCKALSNEHLHILGHPTGRLLLEREAYAIDLEAVIAAAAEHGKAIEI
ncbi:MAG TPA: hypothetical protein DD417_11680, partial [Elusimicrobia bacterium]|nr:hypothetical protein [Elusimicrobiota bacterium]